MRKISVLALISSVKGVSSRRYGSSRALRRSWLSPSIEQLWARQHEESYRLTREITRFALRKFGDRIYEAWQDFNMSAFPKPLEESADERQIFMPYFLFHWSPDGKSTTRRTC